MVNQSDEHLARVERAFENLKKAWEARRDAPDDLLPAIHEANEANSALAAEWNREESGFDPSR